MDAYTVFYGNNLAAKDTLFIYKSHIANSTTMPSTNAALCTI